MGYLLSSLAGGPLLKRVSERLLVAIGLGITAVALGQGFSEVIANSLVIRLEKPGESRLVNLMHAFYCVGAVIGPLIVGVLAVLNFGFVNVFAIAGVVQALVAVLMVSVYWLGLLMGRLGLSFFYKGQRQEYMLALLAVASVFCYGAVILMPSAVLAIAAAFLTGLAFSGIYPMVKTLVE